MVNVLGLDIGGANTKAAFIKTADSKINVFKATLEYFPFWKRDTEELCAMLSRLSGKVAGSAKLDCVAVTLTAELSDVYRTKREGVNHILDCVSRVFGDSSILVVTVDSVLKTVQAAKAEPLKAAGANWAATGWTVAQQIRNCVIVDIGSTSASIIPIVDGKVAAAGKTDLEKLMNGELVYTGSLRTNVAAIVQSVPLKGAVARVSSELFAQSGDVHLVLGNIRVEDYTSETADGRGKTKAELLARLARVVCADTELLTEQEITQIAAYVYKNQVKQISEGLSQVYARLGTNAKVTVPAVVAGLGQDFLARKAAQKAGVTAVLDINKLIPGDGALVSPAVGAALMAATKLEGRRLEWTL